MATKPSYKNIAYTDFSGGWNADSSPDALADNQCERFDNVDTSVVKALKQRSGIYPINTTAIAGDVEFLYEWNRKDGSKVYLGIIKNTSNYSFGYFDPVNDWVFTSILTLLSPDIGYLAFNDKFYLTGKVETTSTSNLFISDHGMVAGDLVKNQTLRDDAVAIANCVRSIYSVDDEDSFTVLSSITGQAEGDRIRLYTKLTSDLAEAGTNPLYIVITGHNLEKGDFIRNNTKAGGYIEVDIVDGEKIYLAQTLIANASGDTIEMYKFKKERTTKFKSELYVYDGVDINPITPYGGVHQVETATVVGTITTAGTARVVVIAKDSGADLQVPVLLGDDASAIASHIRKAIRGHVYLSADFDVTGTGATIILTKKVAADNDTTMNIDIDNNTCAGITAAHTSVNTIAGVAQGSGISMGPIRRCRCFAWNPKNGRIFATRDHDDVSCLYFSEANDPTYFKNTSKVYPTLGEGEAIGITPFSTGIIMEFNNALWSWTGYDPAADAEWGRLPIAHGCSVHGSICQTPNSLTMFGIGGLYALSPGVMDKDLMMINASEMSVNLSDGRVSSVLESASHKTTMISCYQITKQRYLLAYGDDSSNPKNNRILVYDFARNCFGRFTGVQVDCFCPCDNGDILIGSGTYILKMEQGLNDFDIATGEEKAIKVEVKSKGWDFGSPFIKKSLKKMLVSCYQYNDKDTTLDIGILGGYKSILFPDVPMNQSMAWGDDWGDIWGWDTNMTREFKTRIKANRFQLYVVHECVDEDMLIYGVAFKYKVTQMKGVRYSGTSQKDILS